MNEIKLFILILVYAIMLWILTYRAHKPKKAARRYIIDYRRLCSVHAKDLIKGQIALLDPDSCDKCKK